MSVRDVAEYILRSRGEMTAMKLQKLVYYAQAWSLVWDERPLFDESIQAWANGPVCRSLYSAHHRQFSVVPGSILPAVAIPQLDDRARATIDAVMKFYGDKSAQWLSDLTHLEMPWRRARERAGVPDGAQCEEEITLADMHEYYSGLRANNPVV
ncbi:Panacea domain-containing protein [Rhizobium brockwellii]|uniref:Panacea domain-containing protein n=1 Tax=Rhizobium brockwellii TaxID=3019932 RepID=UPI003F9E3A04